MKTNVLSCESICGEQRADQERHEEKAELVLALPFLGDLKSLRLY
ncbi:hypothetical protein VEA_000610 [Vibrio antiquarius]|uniref:Uncharacterized protein n=1 Tax=Vibrio antiquarius (strain Ex25) TaxID=150340 RepID=A0ACA6QT95_VIBAE|nr:hypothetical protein VEA_000610 [Vibrio antiquarius]